MKFLSDVLVIGSGIAGLVYTLEIAKKYNVILITKKDKTESNTNYAQGGIASVFSSEDSFESHIKDTIETGAGICDFDSVEFIIKNGPNEIKKLLNFGANFTLQKDGKLDLGMEGGHSFNRIVHAKDLTGKELETLLLKKISQNENIKIFENNIAIELLTEHHIPNLKERVKTNRKCLGAYALDITNNKVHTFLAKLTVLATGGLGQAYLFTTNPSIATGDGFSMAFRAGASIANMEFIQFHPTSLWEHKKSNNSYHKSFLISEAVRGKGAVLRLKNGDEFMSKYDNRKELASRDIVARAIDNELKKSGDEFVNLDITHLSKDRLIDYFPNIYNKCLELNIDISKDYIPIVPAAHYACGGVVTDLFGQTSIKNLFAIGEVAYTGVHGANRLASNSLLEALIFGNSAAQKSLEHLSNFCYDMLPNIPDWDSSGTTTQDEMILISQTRKEIRQILWDYVGIVRSIERLNRANKRINIILEENEYLYKKLELSEELIELRNLSLVAKLIIDCAISRKESRGLHYNIDFPNLNDFEFKKPTFLKNESL